MSRGLKICITIAAGILCLLLGMGLGSVPIGPGDMLAILRNRLAGVGLPEHISGNTASILLTLRMPRAIMAFLTGAALAATVREWIDQLPPERRAPEELRQRRLSACRSCHSLADGLCALCGCYVEYRAAQRERACPDVPGKW